MNVIRAEHAGFCWGVTRVVRLAEEAAEESQRKVYTYGPLIHNPTVIESLEKKGVCAIDANGLNDLPKDTTIILRAHGVPPDEEEKLRGYGCGIINGTCPHVVRIEKTVAKAHKEGRHVVILGDKGHAEVDALTGYANNDATVVSSDKDCEKVPADRGVTLVAQSTLDADCFHRWTDILQQRVKDIEIHNTRCDATEKRQNAAIELCRSVDMMIVIGGRASANTRRLAEICSAQGVRTQHIERASELEEISFEGVCDVGVTAGASTPEWIIKEVVEYLESV